ncbi:hypothetical protein VNO77_02606 [Canavalia gladiata]|uniref:Uncharacterized protein n=1 Tax=Canavalia gladiata TaxID=3824 RepID=A0AAN9MTH9_CANGL
MSPMVFHSGDSALVLPTGISSSSKYSQLHTNTDRSRKGSFALSPRRFARGRRNLHETSSNLIKGLWHVDKPRRRILHLDL